MEGFEIDGPKYFQMKNCCKFLNVPQLWLKWCNFPKVNNAFAPSSIPLFHFCLLMQMSSNFLKIHEIPQSHEIPPASSFKLTVHYIQNHIHVSQNTVIKWYILVWFVLFFWFGCVSALDSEIQ